MRVGIFAKVSEINRDWLVVRATEDGVMLWEILDLLLTEAREDNCKFRRGNPAVMVRP